jgi:hypothetical protein
MLLLVVVVVLHVALACAGLRNVGGDAPGGAQRGDEGV